MLAASAGDSIASCISRIASLCFKFDSPSRLLVSTYAIPFGFELFNKIKSAGNLSYSLTLTT